MRAELKHLIDRVLVAGQPGMWYYQGYHDVVTTFLLVCRSTQLAECVVERVSRSHLRPMLGKDLTEVVALLNKMFPIVAAEDAELHAFLQASGVQPFFALPWVLTWFAHSVANFETVCRLFDLFLASEPSMPLFVAVAIVLWSKAHVMRVPCEYSAVHSFFSKLFSDISLRLNVEDNAEQDVYLARRIDEDVERIIARAVALHRKWRRRVVGGVHDPFAPNDVLLQYSVVHLSELPRSACKPIVAFQYRFEGVRKLRVVQQRRWFATVATVALVVMLVVALLARLIVRLAWPAFRMPGAR